MRKDFLIFGSPLIEQADIDEVVATLKSGWIGSGPRVSRFEADFAHYKGATHAAAVNSCTAALHLSMIAAGIGPGDEVITTPLTFCATVNAILHCGAKPVLADVDPATMNIDPARIADRITERTKALLVVHFAGRPCDMDAITALTREHSLLLIEDCAHAIETTYQGRHAGTFGNYGCFSFYVTKNLVTGEGGMVLSRDNDAICRIRTLALHGMSCDAWKRFSDAGYKHYLVTEPGFKYNMTDMQAALALNQLPVIEERLLRREAIWAAYDNALAGLPLVLPSPPETDVRHARHLYTIRLTGEARLSRDAFLEAMTRRNIGCGVHYMSLPEHPFYQSALLWDPDHYPAARDIGRSTVSLPLSAKLTDQDMADVIEAVQELLA